MTFFQTTISYHYKWMIKEVKRYAKEHCKYPLLEEYDFRNDHKNPLLSMDLRPSTTIRVTKSQIAMPSFLR